ncbi:MFS transporter [Halorussus salinisoli]|uniref:MFS transporter n=1 Tax=Halorussus salinisoli TaxID=2558242 RepID=UPI0010C16C66|nr:MFS transporter [Halorussus salinisoli]
MNDNDRAIIGFTTISHALVHTYELSIPILMTIWLVEFPVTPATLGTVVAVGYALMGIGALPSGILADAYGSRPVIAACLAGMGGSFLILGLAPNLVGVAVALSLWGVAASIYHPAGLALLSKGVTVRGRAFGYHGMGGNVGIALGPLATALLLLAFDWQIVTTVLAIPALVTAVYGLRRDFDETAAVTADSDVGTTASDGGTENLPSTDGGEDGTREESSLSASSLRSDARRLFTVAFGLVFLVVMFNGLYYRGIITFLPELLGDFLRESGFSLSLFGGETGPRSELDLGRYLYSGLLTVGIFGQYVGGHLIDRLPLRWTFAALLGLLSAIAVAFVPAASLGLGPLLLASAVLGFTLFAVQPVSQAIVAAYSPSDVRGLSYGFTYLAVFGIGALGASLSGIALTYGTATTTFLVQAGIAAMGAVVCLVLIRTQKEPADAAD